MEQESEKRPLLLSGKSGNSLTEKEINSGARLTSCSSDDAKYGSVAQRERKTGSFLATNMQQALESNGVSPDKKTKDTDAENALLGDASGSEGEKPNPDDDVTSMTKRRKRFLFVAMAVMDFFGGMLFGMIAPFFPTVVSVQTACQ